MKLEEKIPGKRTGKLGKRALYTAAVLVAAPFVFSYGKMGVEVCKEIYYSFTSSRAVEFNTEDRTISVYGYDSDKNGSIGKIEVVNHGGPILGAAFGQNIHEYTLKDKEFKHYYQILMEKKK